METEEKDYLYYFWNPDHEDWLREFAPLEKDKALKGVTPFGITDWSIWPILILKN